MKPTLVSIASLLLQLTLVSGFAPANPRGNKYNNNGAMAININRSPMKSISAANSPLFMSNKLSSRKATSEGRLSFPLSRLTSALLFLRYNVGRNIRRAMVVVWSAAIIWAASSNLNIQPCHASTMAPSDAIQERILSATSPSLDKIVDRYVKKYMFDDDSYDPVESLYREAYQDATQGTYPRALKEVTSSILGQESGKGLVGMSEKSGENIFGSILSSALGLLQKRGLSEGAAITALAVSFVVAGPFAFLFGGMIIGGMSKRNMNKVMKKRYGDSYSVDATIRTEEEVEAPEDEDDDDEDEDDEGDDEDEDDEDS